MSIINLALSNYALFRELMSEGFEKKMKKCGGMANVRKLAESSREAVEVAPPTNIPPLAFGVAIDATTSGDVAFEVFVEALASMIPPSTIVYHLLLLEMRPLLLLVMMLLWEPTPTYI